MSKKEYLKHWRRNQAELKNLFEEEIPALVSSPEASDFEGEQMRAKIANVSCKYSFSETSELEKTVMMIMKNCHLHFSQLLTP